MNFYAAVAWLPSLLVVCTSSTMPRLQSFTFFSAAGLQMEDQADSLLVPPINHSINNTTRIVQQVLRCKQRAEGQRPNSQKESLFCRCFNVDRTNPIKPRTQSMRVSHREFAKAQSLVHWSNTDVSRCFIERRMDTEVFFSPPISAVMTAATFGQYSSMEPRL